MENTLILQAVIAVAYVMHHAQGYWVRPPTWTIDQSCTVKWIMEEFDDSGMWPYDLEVTMYYSKPKATIVWSIPQQDSFMKWSLNDRELSYVFPIGTNFKGVSKVTQPFQLDTSKEEIALLIMYPDLSQYTKISNHDQHSKWILEGNYGKIRFRSEVWVEHTQGNPELREVIYLEEGRRTVTKFNYQYGEPDLSVWSISDATSYESPNGTLDGKSTAETLVRNYLMGNAFSMTFRPSLFPPSATVDNLSLRSKSDNETPFPYDEDEYENYSYPRHLDWTTCIPSPVKNQYHCNGCASLTLTAVCESAHYIRTKEPVNLAEQAVIDCGWYHYNNGCMGGFPQFILNWIIHNKGIPKREEYGFGQFRRMNGRCVATDPKYHAARVTSWTKIPPSVNAMKMVLLRHGPFLAGVTVDDLYNYSPEKVIGTPGNKTNKIHHAGQVMGWNGSYWIVKNTWGSSWGNNGSYYVDMSAVRNPMRLMDEMLYVNLEGDDGRRPTDTYFDMCHTRA